MADVDSALAELDAWAGNEACLEPTSNQHQNSQGEQPCLESHQISALLRLARNIKGAPLPSKALPAIPR